MREAAERLLATLPEPQRKVATRAFDDGDRVDWHYTPRSRNGLSFKELDSKGRDAVHALLKTALSAVGYRKVVNIIELELVLREMETFGLMRDPERYHVTIYGVPSRVERWGWRFEGHHLSLNFTLAGDRLVVDTPSFFGANPAEVPKGSKKGLRVLGDEHDAGWAVLDSLSESQRRDAVISTRTYGDIVTTNRDKVAPLEAAGIRPRSSTSGSVRSCGRSSSSMRRASSRALRRRVSPARGRAASTRCASAGQDRRRAGAALLPGAGERFLIEYDASQDGGNHIHTVWRDYSGDFGRELPAKAAFGRDLLRDHYASARGTSHRH
jgi:hypothetical protein